MSREWPASPHLRRRWNTSSNNALSGDSAQGTNTELEHALPGAGNNMIQQSKEDFTLCWEFSRLEG